MQSCNKLKKINKKNIGSLNSKNYTKSYALNVMKKPQVNKKHNKSKTTHYEWIPWDLTRMRSRNENTR